MAPSARALLAGLAALVLLPTAASAAERTMPVRVTLLGQDAGVATLALETTSDTAATATLRAPGVLFGGGKLYRVSTCVEQHAQRALPLSSCTTADVDVRGLTGRVARDAPAVTSAVRRPKAGVAMAVTGVVTINQRMVDGAWKEVATTWTAGRAGASLAVPPSGATSGVLPTLPDGATLSTGAVGGMNTGAPGSICGQNLRGTTMTRPAGLDTKALGAAAYPYEVGEPTTGAAPRGVALVLHGGGWATNGIGALETERPTADAWRARGFRTVNATYRACAGSLIDALDAFDRIHRAWPDLAVCVDGASAGGHLALSVAANRPVACAVSRGGPADAEALAGQDAAPGPGGSKTDGPRSLQNFMAAAFGNENLDLASPVRGTTGARVLMGVAESDWLVPWAQAEELRDAWGAEVVRLAAGDRPWVHGNVSADALADWERRVDALAAGV
ncbi:MAG: hypothetical protein HZB46_00935 [Solirubrobacterales bacterium]|nr:hypothetical protein [Solirubrobacterales bacterium]